jgi:cellulose synthase/poly-beta-1,6-N-acetylglucosamine synthase-like glycosyltransferase
VIAVHNEEKHIQKKINNLLNQKYPNDLFEIIVISDGSTDSTNDLMKRIFKSRETLKPKINFVVYERRRGKAYALNQGVRCAKGEILVFTDARQEFDSFALCELVANFNDPQVGAVTGELFLGETSKGGVHKAVELYWDYEKWIRRMEGNIDSVVGVTGAISAVRKSLYEPMPFGTILDDLFIPMSVVMKGFRVVFDDQAKAYDNQLIESKSEFRRKVRTAMGNFQVIQLLPGILSIRKNRILISFVSHKLFRLLIPYFLMAIFVLNWLKLEGIYSIVFAGQLAFYILALTGILVSANKVVFKLISVPYTYIVLNCAAVWGFIAFLRKDKSVWDKKK